MESSDEEVEEVVSEYYFEDDKAEPISFAVLPVCWNTNEVVEGSGKKIYVRGKSDGGLGKFYKRVKAWKLDMSGVKPEISVLSEGKNWIKLQKPRISYEEFSRTVLITVNFLHLVKRNLDLDGKDLWAKLAKIFRLLDVRPSPDDLVDHKALIEKAVEHDDSLRKSKYLMMCLEKNFQKINRDQESARRKEKNAFIVDDDDLEEVGPLAGKDGSVDAEDSSGDEEDGDDEIFDSVCCICDEGGTILCCDGICMRSFHATLRAAREADSKCKSLGITTKEVEAMQTFKCLNCQRKQHQCYSCGGLGSSDKESGAAEVFQCVNATCGYFYHAGCVAKHLRRSNEDASNALQKDIAAGEPFTCPLHVCFVCRQPEDKTDPEMRMAVCRRCPKAYHKKCLPRDIAFEDDEDEGAVQRAWDNLLAGRILIYCLKHEINEDLGTPLRDHIKFPADVKKEIQPFAQQTMKSNVLLKNKKPSVTPSRLGPALEPERTLLGNHTCKTDQEISQTRGADKLGNVSLENKRPSSKLALKSSEQSDLAKCKKSVKLEEKKYVEKLDPDSMTSVEKRIVNCRKEASLKITMDDIIAKQEKLIPSEEYKKKMDFGKSITEGRLQGLCQGIQAASKILDEGGSIEKAKQSCQREALVQVVRWKSKLKVYLAPFFYGMRYTSFGRHFTKKDKLIEIVDKIHWYVNNNDTIVDFCCGANDWSLLMKKKLESTGKTCNYKNYDLFTPKEDFCFEQRNWYEVQPNEIPKGSELIIGLNPPFGVKASLANKFINKALEFKPKLLILIVPQETQRLDKKKTPYDLIWEDRDKLSGKSFYLPGSVDTNNKQMEDWNLVPPILYLWSRGDWTAKHKAVAFEHGHLHGGEIDKDDHTNRPGPERSSEKYEHVLETKVDDVSPFTDAPERLKETAAGEKQMTPEDHLGETHVSGLVKNRRFNGNSRKKRHGEEINAREGVESSREYKRGRSSPFNPHERWPCHSPANARYNNLSSPPLRPANLEIMDPGDDPKSYVDGRYHQESLPRGYEEFPSDTMVINDPSRDHFHPPTMHGGPRSGFPVLDGRYDDRAGTHHPHIDYPLQVRPPIHDYPSQLPGEWVPAYTEAEHGFRQSAFSTESGYGRMNSMSVMDAYGPRLGESDHSRIGGYDPGLGHPSGPSVYHQDPRHGYPGGPMGFASRPPEPFHHPHSSSGGWIDD